MNARFPKHIPVLFAILVFNATAATRYVDLNSPNPTSPYVGWATASTNIQDAIDAAEDGDLVLVTNGVYSSGGRAVYGTMTNRVMVSKPLIVQSANGPGFTVIEGFQPPGVTLGSSSIRCVYLTDNAVISGFTLTNGATQNWINPGNPTAEHNGGGVFAASQSSVVSNCVITLNSARGYGGGVYSGTLRNCSISNNVAVLGGGGAALARLENCLVVSNSATRNSGGGAYDSTLIECLIQGNDAGLGGGAYGSAVTNCMVFSNIATFAGGGLRGGIVDSSHLTGNSAIWNSSNGKGGGALDAVVVNTLVSHNSSFGRGGGVAGGQIFSATIVSNSALLRSGGADSSILFNCIVYYNTCAIQPDVSDGSTLFSCCAGTLPPASNPANENITNAPLFVIEANCDYRLHYDSPCINAGKNAKVTGAKDLDGGLRIVGGTVDIGAYEFQLPTSSLSYAWAQLYGLPTDGSADSGDFDGDGADNEDEWRADTNPTNALSVLRMLSVDEVASGLSVAWQSVATRNYWLERGTSFGGTVQFIPIATNIMGASGSSVHTDPTATNGRLYFYRIGVH